MLRSCIGLCIFISGAAIAPVHSADGRAQTAAPTEIARQKLSTVVDIAPDSSSLRTEHFERTPLTAAAVPSVSTLTLGLASGDTFEVAEAFTRKPDGRRIPTSAADIVTQSGAVGTSQSFVDTKILQIAFRDVDPGDTIVATVRTKSPKPPPLGGVEGRLRITPVPQTLDVSYEVNVASGMQFQTASAGIDYKYQTAANGITTHRWSGHFAPRAATENNVADPSFADPYFEYSTAPTWESLGRDYWAGASSKIKLTPRVRALAERITQGAGTQREQARALFDWVTDNIRYVAVYMGNGPWVPNELETVIDRRFGDCKDAATLLTALLSAKGIRAEQALVTLTNDYRQFQTPIRAAVNHVLVYLPDLGIYADATNAHTPFGQIEPQIAGKIAVFTGPEGARIGRIPVGSASQNRSDVETSLTISADRKVSLTTKTVSTGDFAFYTRYFSGVAERDGSAAVVDKMLSGASLSGTPTVKFPPSRARTETATLVASVDGSTADTIDPDAFRPTSLTMNDVDMSGLFGRPALPRASALICSPGTLTEKIVVRPPPGTSLAKLPAPTILHTDFADYRSTWRWQDGALTIQRELTSNVTTRACPAAMASAILSFGRKVMTDVSRRIAFKDWPEDGKETSAASH